VINVDGMLVAVAAAAAAGKQMIILKGDDAISVLC